MSLAAGHRPCALVPSQRLQTAAARHRPSTADSRGNAKQIEPRPPRRAHASAARTNNSCTRPRAELPDGVFVKLDGDAGRVLTATPPSAYDARGLRRLASAPNVRD